MIFSSLTNITLVRKSWRGDSWVFDT